MKTGVIIRKTDKLNFGQTVDILDESDMMNSYNIHVHGERKRASTSLPKEFILSSEDAYDYTKNPCVVNPYES